MADNIDIKDAADVTRTVATDEVGGENYQIVKLAHGADGTAADVTAAAPLPIEAVAAQASYMPGYDGPSATPGRLNTDPDGALWARAAVLTDEGTFRANFANTSLAVAVPGTPSRTGTTISGLTLPGLDLHVGDYVKFDADGESAWAEVTALVDDATIEVAAYSGATSGAMSRALVRPITGTGGSMSVASGQLTINSGTTSGSRTGVTRVVDYAPLVLRARFSLSQRVANTEFVFGLQETELSTARWFARFRFTGTTNTQVICETARNPTTTPSASETQSTTVTIPATSALLDYRIEQLTESVRFYANGVLVAEHATVIPSQHDEMIAFASWVNTGAPATTSSVVCDYITAKNHNKLEVGVMSDAEQIGVRAAAGPVISYSVAGVITINTTLIQLDCSQYQGVSIHCHSIGTTGVITPEWSADGTSWTTATVTTVAGANATTLAATTQYVVPRAARYFRLRLSTATTAGTTTVHVQGLPFPVAIGLATQPVSGTVTANLGTGGTGATAIGKAEDAAAASGDTGVFCLAVRRDALNTAASTTGDYNEIAVNRFGALYNVDFRLLARTYRSVTAAFAPAATATDIWDLFGNGTSTVVVTRLRVMATQTTGGVVDLRARIRTTATTPGGGRVAGTVVKLEQADSASNSTPGHYTANPTTPGTDGGAIAGGLAFVGATTVGPGIWEMQLGDKGKGVVLSGTAQGLVLNLNGVTVTGGSFVVECEWYEF